MVEPIPHPEMLHSTLLKRTKIAATIGASCASQAVLTQMVRTGADAFLLGAEHDSPSLWQSRCETIRQIEAQTQIPLAIIIDLADTADALEWVGASEVDYIATSVPRGARDLMKLRDRLKAAGSAASVLARLDHAENYRDIESIIQAADGIIVTTRGLQDLEIWSIPVMQKMVARQCQIGAKPCLVDRDILESMKHGTTPTHSEVFDIANVVFDHADAILLRDETAVGEFPIHALEVVSKTVIATESLMEITDRPIKVGFGQPPNTAALAYSIRHILKMQEIAAVSVYSHSTSTARLIANNWIDCPILALSDIPTTARQMSVYHGVLSRHVTAPKNTADMLAMTTRVAKELGLVAPGDRMIVVSELPLHAAENANAFVIETIE